MFGLPVSNDFVSGRHLNSFRVTIILSTDRLNSDSRILLQCTTRSLCKSLQIRIITSSPAAVINEQPSRDKSFIFLQMAWKQIQFEVKRNVKDSTSSHPSRQHLPSTSLQLICKYISPHLSRVHVICKSNSSTKSP